MRIVTLIAALCLSSVAFAGHKADIYGGLVQVSEGSGSYTFSGQFGAVRNYANDSVSFLGCSVSFYQGHPANAPLVYCSARTYDGRIVSCSVWSNQFAAVLGSLNSDSSVSIGANKVPGSYSAENGNCTSIKVENASYFSPKAP